MIKRIILDLDDVLNSCTMYILHVLGCGVGPFDYHKYPIEVGYDMVGAWARLTGRPRVSLAMFWEWVARKHWEDMPVSDQFWVIDIAADLVGRENVLIASSPTKSPDCLYGKYQWMDQHLPDWMHRQYEIGPRKHWLSQPDTLLIDDCDENCNKFRDPGGGFPGGEAILLPRPWNSNKDYSSHCSQYLAEQLERYFGNEINIESDKSRFTGT